MRGISILLLCVLMAAASFAAAQPAIVYHLLSSRQAVPAEGIPEFDYNISVDQYMDSSGIKNVICQLIRNEKPAAYDILSAGVYYKLDRYVPESEGDVGDAAEHRQRRIAQYHWNKDSPKDSRRLVVTKDPKGQSLPDWRFYNFDHTKACR